MRGSCGEAVRCWPSACVSAPNRFRAGHLEVLRKSPKPGCAPGGDSSLFTALLCFPPCRRVRRCSGARRGAAAAAPGRRGLRQHPATPPHHVEEGRQQPRPGREARGLGRPAGCQWGAQGEAHRHPDRAPAGEEQGVCLPFPSLPQWLKRRQPALSPSHHPLPVAPHIASLYLTSEINTWGDAREQRGLAFCVKW